MLRSYYTWKRFNKKSSTKNYSVRISIYIRKICRALTHFPNQTINPLNFLQLHSRRQPSPRFRNTFSPTTSFSPSLKNNNDDINDDLDASRHSQKFTLRRTHARGRRCKKRPTPRIRDTLLRAKTNDARLRRVSQL